MSRRFDCFMDKFVFSFNLAMFTWAHVALDWRLNGLEHLSNIILVDEIEKKKLSCLSLWQGVPSRSVSLILP